MEHLLSITPPKLMEPQGGGAESLSWRMGRSDEKCCFWGAQGFCTLELMVTMVTGTGSSQQDQSASWRAALIALNGWEGVGCVGESLRAPRGSGGDMGESLGSRKEPCRRSGWRSYEHMIKMHCLHAEGCERMKKNHVLLGITALYLRLRSFSPYCIFPYTTTSLHYITHCS